ncbi:MAG: flagellar hook-basal body complex protein FliE [Hyphomonas sp.]
MAGLNPYASFQAVRPGAATPASAPAKPEQEKNIVAEGVADFKTALQEAETTAMQTAVSGADPHAMIEALANAELVLDTAVTIRDKVVEAYQELLRMPV